MKFDTEIEKHMLSSKNAEAGVYDRLPRWLTPPYRKSLSCYKTGGYGLMLT
jgi:hypothetical protein